MIKKLVEHVVKTLVDKPDEVSINQVEREGKTVIEVAVGHDDLGRVIGKDGQTIRALRVLVAAVRPEGQDILVNILK